MQRALVLIIAFLVTPSFSGCLEPEDKRTVIEEPGLFDSLRIFNHITGSWDSKSWAIVFPISQKEVVAPIEGSTIG